MEDMRGKIEFRERKKQIITFENLRYGNITPTDIDCTIDYHGDVFAFVEIKYEDTELKDGQRKYLENVVNGLSGGGCEAAAFVASHSVENTNEDIDAADCIVRKVYVNHRWWSYEGRNKTLKELLDSFLKEAEDRKKKREKARAITKITAQYANALTEILKK